MIDPKDKLISKITQFLNSIGIETQETKIHEATFLPGICIKNGVLLFDSTKIYPGDLLHEAGHIALMPSKHRIKLSGDVDKIEELGNDGLEIGAICWSYAAAKYLDIDLNILFHKDGYKGEADWHINNFQSGNYIGLPLLQWMEMCKGPTDTTDLKPFPHMIKWLRD